MSAKWWWLGGSTWQRVRERTRQAIKQMAAELLDLYPRRTISIGFAFPPDTKWQRELESSFLYEDLTAEQNLRLLGRLIAPAG